MESAVEGVEGILVAVDVQCDGRTFGVEGIGCISEVATGYRVYKP